ncbi:MAG: MBL fold metallo-hydrolase [Acidobacteriota bacterium]
MRRTILIRATGIGLALLGALAAYTQAPAGGQGTSKAPAALTLIKVADDLYDLEGSGGNVGIYITDEGVILVDDKFEQDYDQILASVRKLTNQPVKYVINTHHHGDHSGSNAKMLASGIEVLLHKNARKNMVDGKMPGTPRVAFADQLQVVLGGKEVMVRHYGRGHTNGDVVVFFPARRAIHTGDLFVASDPLIDYSASGSMGDWPRTLDQVLANDFDTVIPGHGPLSKKADLAAFRDRMKTMADKARQQVQSGKTKAQLREYMVTNYGWGDMQDRIGEVDGMLAEFK